MFIVGLALGLNTVFMEKFNVGAKGAEWSFTLIDRIPTSSGMGGRHHRNTQQRSGTV